MAKAKAVVAVAGAWTGTVAWAWTRAWAGAWPSVSVQVRESVSITFSRSINISTIIPVVAVAGASQHLPKIRVF